MAMYILFCLVLVSPLVQTLDQEQISQNIHNVFFEKPIAIDDKVHLLENIRNNYRQLKTLKENESTKSLKEIVGGIKTYLVNIERRILNGDTNLEGMFEDVTEYLRQGSSKKTPHLGGYDDVVVEELTNSILCDMDRKLSTSATPRHDLNNVLLIMSDSELCRMLRQESGLDASAVGYFFLEMFATIVGLSWGIVSMYL